MNLAVYGGDSVYIEINDSIIYDKKIFNASEYSEYVYMLFLKEIDKIGTLAKFYINIDREDTCFYYDLKNVDSLLIVHRTLEDGFDIIKYWIWNQDEIHEMRENSED